jgi:hypothetical protein
MTRATLRAQRMQAALEADESDEEDMEDAQQAALRQEQIQGQKFFHLQLSCDMFACFVGAVRMARSNAASALLGPKVE